MGQMRYLGDASWSWVWGEAVAVRAAMRRARGGMSIAVEERSLWGVSYERGQSFESVC